MPTVDKRALTAPHAPFFASLPPAYAAYFRGMTGAAVLAVVEALIHYLQVGPAVPPAWAVFVPVAVVLLRTAEGLVDHHSTRGGNAPRASTRETALIDAVTTAVAAKASAPVSASPVTAPAETPAATAPTQG